MDIKFYKYNGAGNDFVILDNRENWFDWKNKDLIVHLCDRKFGVGADGVLLLQNKDDFAFEMLYANADGSRGSMCGNGGRCITAFAEKLGIIKKEKLIKFLGPDGDHDAEVLQNNNVRLKMQDVPEITRRNGLSFIDTGAPHYIQQVVHLDTFPVVSEAHKVKADDPDPAGININYLEEKDEKWKVRTYERGVEDETLACGTGATACALYLSHIGKISQNNSDIHMPGGILNVSFDRDGGGFKNIWLKGLATFVFEGSISI